METSLHKLFSDQGRKYKVPVYQRSYSWENKQTNQFIQDLREAKGDYYLGHFLFETDEESNSKGGVQTWLIIDGQQRLTTCLIFFSALLTELLRRKAAGDPITVDLSDLEDYYLRSIRKGTQRLETVTDDNNFFVVAVVNRNGPDAAAPETRSQGFMRDALVFFQDILKNESLSEIERWHNLLTEAKCTQYCVQNKVSAAKIFAFQNDRGKRLSDLEVLKSYFMLQVLLMGGTSEVVAEHIQYLESEISTIYRQIVRVDLGEDEVLRYCWQASEHSPGYNTRKPVDEIKSYVTAAGSGKTCERIREFMTDLAQAFRIVESIERSGSPTVVNLRYLNNMALSYPFLIKARLAGATDKEMERLERLLENITFRTALRGGRAAIESRLNEFLGRRAGPAYVKEVVEETILKLKSDWNWGYWSDSAMESLLEDGHFYGNRVDNYLLWRYELDLCSASGYPPSLKVGYKDLVDNESIEHIAPQTETHGGSLAAGYGVYNDGQNGIESGEWMSCLGNLMLISRPHNSSIGNQPFATKLASYGAANLLQQQKEIIQFVEDPHNPVWDVAAISKRQDKILATAKRLWSLDTI